MLSLTLRAATRRGKRGPCTHVQTADGQAAASGTTGVYLELSTVSQYERCLRDPLSVVQQRHLCLLLQHGTASVLNPGHVRVMPARGPPAIFGMKAALAFNHATRAAARAHHISNCVTTLIL